MKYRYLVPVVAKYYWFEIHSLRNYKRLILRKYWIFPLSGADISSMVNQAALKAGIDGVSSVNMSHLNYAKDKILMGEDNGFQF